MHFEGNVFTITGKISGLTREQAINEIKKRGGQISPSLTKKTTVLIVGKQKSSEESNKIKKAKKYQKDGVDIKIINSIEFLKEMSETQLYFNI